MFNRARDAFIDTMDDTLFIKLDKSIELYEDLKLSVQKPLKMVLVYGEPGTGKSMLLNRLYNDLEEQKGSLFYPIPMLDEDIFFSTIAKDIFYDKSNNITNFSELTILLQNSTFKQVPIIILDEAQLYSQTIMEKIRLLSDTRKIKFIIALHKTEKEDLVAKEHFQTRIWKSIVLKNSTKEDLKVYIQKKLLNADMFQVSNMFDLKAIKLIYKFTDGNLRDTNKLLYSLFGIYEYYEEHKPSSVNSLTIKHKYIEMAAIDVGFINA